MDFLLRRGFILPLVMAGALPAAILAITDAYGRVTVVSAFLAAPLVLVGLGLLLATTRLFDARGGSLAPWNPPPTMVASGAYRYLRNPMILGIFLILAGEAIIFRSEWIVLWLVIFVVAKQAYIVLDEEPQLRKRFGHEYAQYCREVPRWLPHRPSARVSQTKEG